MTREEELRDIALTEYGWATPTVEQLSDVERVWMSGDQWWGKDTLLQGLDPVGVRHEDEAAEDLPDEVKDEFYASILRRPASFLPAEGFCPWCRAGLEHPSPHTPPPPPDAGFPMPLPVAQFQRAAEFVREHPELILTEVQSAAHWLRFQGLTEKQIAERFRKTRGKGSQQSVSMALARGDKKIARQKSMEELNRLSDKGSEHSVWRDKADFLIGYNSTAECQKRRRRKTVRLEEYEKRAVLEAVQRLLPQLRTIIMRRTGESTEWTESLAAACSVVCERWRDIDTDEDLLRVVSSRITRQSRRDRKETPMDPAEASMATETQRDGKRPHPRREG